MEKIIILLILSISYLYAGFWSSVAAGMVANSLSGSRTTVAYVQKLDKKQTKEMKIQQALYGLGYYDKKLDGNLNTMASRLAIKEFQKFNGVHVNGILDKKNREHLLYIHELFELLINKPKKEKRVQIYNEIDDTILLMKSNSKNYMKGRGNIKITNKMENAIVYVDGKKITSIRIGYASLYLLPGKHNIEIRKLSLNGEWLYKVSKTINIIKNKKIIKDMKVKKFATKKYKDRLAKEAKNKEIELLVEAKIKNKQKKQIKEYNRKLWNSTQIYIDLVTKLVWQDSYIKISEYNGSVQYCKNLAYANSKNWRLPTRKELKRLSKFNNELTEKSPDNTYWASEGNMNGYYQNNFQYVDLSNGKSYGTFPSNNKGVRCVRDFVFE